MESCRTVELSRVFKGNRHVREIVDLALAEDLGTGDVTTDTVIPSGTRASARIVVRQAGVIAGLPVAAMVLKAVDPAMTFSALVEDGSSVRSDQCIAEIGGSAMSLLRAERTVLNFLMRLSGIATATAAFVRTLEGSGIRLLDTRKTTPGHRVLDKYAVALGGGLNHRMNLAGGILIKNNHISTCGGIEAAIRAARAKSPVTLKVEIEVRTLAEAISAAAAGADMLLLDHMNPAEVSEVRRMVGNGISLEISGNMTPEKAAEYAGCGADYVSAGSITYNAGWLDISMYLELDGPLSTGAR